MLLPRREGEAVVVVLSSGNLAGRVEVGGGNTWKITLYVKKSFVGGCVSCSSKLMLKSLVKMVCLLVDIFCERKLSMEKTTTTLSCLS